MTLTFPAIYTTYSVKSIKKSKLMLHDDVIKYVRHVIFT